MVMVPRRLSTLTSLWISTILSNVAPIDCFQLPKSSKLSKIRPSNGIFASTTTNAPTGTLVDLDDAIKGFDAVDAVVCGGGPAGLLTAIMLAQTRRFQKIQLYDRLSSPPSPDDDAAWSNVAKFYLVGLGGRGQAALQRFGVWDEVKKRSVIVRGRRDWSPDGPTEGVERIFGPERAVQTHVLPRDKLVGVLYKHILENYADKVKLNYGCQVEPFSFSCGNDSRAVVRITPCQEDKSGDVECDISEAKMVSTELLVAADGTVRTIANEMEANDLEKRKMKNPISKLFGGPRFQVKRYEDDNQRVYKTVPFKVPWRPDLNYSARTKRIGFDALPANHDAEYCGVLLMKKEDPLADSGTDPAALRSMLDQEVPQFSNLISDETVVEVAAKPISYLPGFRYAGPRLHEESSTLLIGDCAHTVKPYFGLGANSALEDVEELYDYLNNHEITASAIKSYSKQRASEAKTLVRISRELDRPGIRGFLVFVLPIILDGIFGKFAPKIFAPNIITMLQKDSLTFKQVARRKRLDRLLQFVIIGTIAASSVIAVKVGIRTILSLSGRLHSCLW